MSATRKKKAHAPRRGTKWSAEVAARSDALDLEPGVFRKTSPRAIAMSLKKSAERSRRLRASPFQSAMSMLNLFINRAGRTLDEGRRRILERAKDELRRLFGRATRAARPHAHAHARQ
jgi:hypothetical protein